MSAYRHRATWRSTTFNEGYADVGAAADDPANIVEANLNNQITIDELNIQRVSAQDYRELRQYLEGAEPNEAYEGVRAITGTGIIAGTSPGDLEDKAWGLNEQFSIAACRIAAAALDPVGVLPFDFKRDTGATTLPLRFYARPGPARPVWIGRRNEGLTRPWSFQLVAFDPFAYSQTESQTALGNLAGGGNTVTNSGNIYTKPKIRVTWSGAGAASIVLTNTTTGQSFTFNGSTAAAAEVWIIDVARSRMYRESDGANRFSTRLAGFISSLILLPGANNLTWSVGTGITSVRVDARAAYA